MIFEILSKVLFGCCSYSIGSLYLGDGYTNRASLSNSSEVVPFLANMFATLLSVSLLALPRTGAASTAFETNCLAFRPEKYIDGATRNVLQFVTSGTTLTFPDNDVTCNRASQAVSTNLCRIALSISTSKTSNITFEAWLPEGWSGRFLATGNGGIDGCNLKPRS
jgi:feruloyl esterase